MKRKRTGSGLWERCPLCFVVMSRFRREDGAIEHECEPCVAAAKPRQMDLFA